MRVEAEKQMPSEWSEINGFAYQPAPDALWRHAPTPLAACYNVLGVPLEVQTNAPRIAELAEAFYGDWRAVEAESTQRKRLCLYLHDAPEETPDAASVPLVRMQGAILMVSLGGSLGFADATAGFGAAFLTPGLLANPALATMLTLECLGLYLVCCERPAPLHAAGLVHQGRCVLLTGGSGAGKSTLAYACLRAGFGLLAEDIVYAEPGGETVTVWGWPWSLHLLPDAVRFFPELENAERIQKINGETKLRVAVNRVRPGAAVPKMPVWGVCSLGRAEDAASRLRPADPNVLCRTLTHFAGDPPLDRQAMEAATERLLAGRLAHLAMGTDLDAAAGALCRWIETG